MDNAFMQELLTGKTRLPGFSGAWETITLGEVADIRNGATPSTHIGAYWNGPIPWCIPTDITATPGKYLLATERSITAAGLASCGASLLPVGALLLCSRATIGELKIAASPVCTNQGFKSIVCKDDVFNEFLYYLLLTRKPQMIERATGSTFLEIGKRDVESIQLRVPPLSEQRAIAEALSDVDGLLAALEALIAKKRAVKQAAMQELLTGKTRLPGFSGTPSEGVPVGYKRTEVGMIPEDWDICALHDVIEKFVNGGTPSTSNTDFWSGDIPWITGADILNQTVAVIRRYITKEAVYNSSTNVITKGNLLIVSRTGLGKLAIAPCDIAISQDFTGLIHSKEKILAQYLFRHFDFCQQVLTKQNQGTSIKGITRDTLSTILIPLPCLHEQTAIASVLSDMDAEIAALEHRRDKTRAVKQGMMQQLLTGRVRLFNPE